ncbi:MAG: hypothetical protein Aurels2KO_55390 [Aureliella sp.]
MKRSEELYEVGYFLCRCGRRLDDKRAASPPPVLGSETWGRAYAVFFEVLSEGRTLQSFSNTLKNIRDVFDAHVDSGRVGWHEGTDATRRPQQLTGLALKVYERWHDRSEAELWARIQEFADLAASNVDQVVLNDELARLDPQQEYVRASTEGGARVVISLRAERSPRARHDAIKIHGTRCMACSFSFGEMYGDWGDGFIEVHHVVPLSEHEQRDTNAATDLIVLCANCHRMVHRKRGTALTLDELKAKIRQ